MVQSQITKHCFDLEEKTLEFAKKAKESHYWLQLLGEANNGFEGEIREMLQEAIELKKIFSSIAEKSS